MEDYGNQFPTSICLDVTLSSCLDRKVGNSTVKANKNQTITYLKSFFGEKSVNKVTEEESPTSKKKLLFTDKTRSLPPNTDL